MHTSDQIYFSYLTQFKVTSYTLTYYMIKIYAATFYTVDYYTHLVLYSNKV